MSTSAGMTPTEAQLYLESQCGLVPVLTDALAELCIERPSDPFQWLAAYLLKHNPNGPVHTHAPSESEICSPLADQIPAPLPAASPLALAPGSSDPLSRPADSVSADLGGGGRKSPQAPSDDAAAEAASASSANVATADTAASDNSNSQVDLPPAADVSAADVSAADVSAADVSGGVVAAAHGEDNGTQAIDADSSAQADGGAVAGGAGPVVTEADIVGDGEHAADAVAAAVDAPAAAPADAADNQSSTLQNQSLDASDSTATAAHDAAPPQPPSLLPAGEDAALATVTPKDGGD